MDAHADLEDLISKVRDARARRHIREAVLAYGTGAYRASIVMTWIAVIYDIIDKIQELELGGDLGARGHLQRLDAIRASNNLGAAQDFERKILDLAAEFQFLSPVDAKDLERLREDRNRCAHPTARSREENYEPPPELARLHLRNAVTHLLSKPPLQGKAALADLMSRVHSDLFPTSPAAAVERFAVSPLSSPREVLVKDFVKLLLKSALLEEQRTAHQVLQHATALKATKQLHPEIAQSAIVANLAPTIGRVPDTRINDVLILMLGVKEHWGDLHPADQNRLTTYTRRMPVADIPSRMDAARRIPQLSGEVAARLASLTADELTNLVARHPTRALADEATRRYREAGNWETANTMAEKFILPLVRHMTPEEQLAVLAASTNGEVAGSWKFQDVIEAIRESGKLTEQQMDDAIEAARITREGPDDS